MTVNVVDALETVEIQKRHSKARWLQPGCEYCLVEPGEKAPAIGQARESVQMGETMVFVAEDLHLLLPVEKRFARPYETRKVIVVPEHDGDEAAGDEDQVYRHGDQDKVARADEEDGERHDHDRGQEQGRAAQMHQAQNAADHRDRHVKGDMAFGIGVAIGVEAEGPGGEHCG